MTPSLEGLPTKTKEAPSPHEVRLTPLDTKPVFQCLNHNIENRLKDMAFCHLLENLEIYMVQNLWIL